MKKTQEFCFLSVVKDFIGMRDGFPGGVGDEANL
jgi:hypothetical protein